MKSLQHRALATAAKARHARLEPHAWRSTSASSGRRAPGKTTLFNGADQAGAGGLRQRRTSASRRRRRAAAADRRGRRLGEADAGHDPADRRPGHGAPPSSAACASADALLAVVRDTDDLTVARARAARRRPGPRRAPARARPKGRQVGRPALRAEAELLEELLAHIDDERVASRLARRAAGRARAADDEAADPDRERPRRSRPRARGRARTISPPTRRRSSETAARRHWRTSSAGCLRRSISSSSSRPATPRRGPGRCGNGTTALDAAESIHTDIARGFIRCEVIRWDDLVRCRLARGGGRAGPTAARGKAYVVADGDVLNIRFNV